MAFNFNIPTIPTIKVPEIKVDIDTSGISSAVQNAKAACQNIDRTSLFAQLASYKIKSMPILGKARPLSEEDLMVATGIVNKINANGWLDAETREWCEANQIPVE